jgi:hypothetical protein
MSVATVGASLGGAASGSAASAGSGVGGSASSASGIASSAGSIGGLDSLLDPGTTFLGLGIDTLWNIINKRESDRRYEDSKNWYQIKVEDMKKAGLNPALMFSRGGPAMSTATQIPKSTPTKLADDFSKLLSSASQAKGVNVQNKAVNSNVNLNKEKQNTERKIQHVYDTQALRNVEEANKIEAEKHKLNLDAAVSTAQAFKIAQEAKRLSFENYRKERQSELYKGKKGKLLTYGEWVADQLGKVFHGGMNYGVHRSTGSSHEYQSYERDNKGKLKRRKKTTIRR